MPQINLGKVYKNPNYAENSAAIAGHIENRPCYFGDVTEVTIFANVPLPVYSEENPYNDDWPGSESLAAGGTYRITVGGVSVELVAFNEAVGDQHVSVTIGDSYLAAQEGSGTPTYGFCLAIFKNGSDLLEPPGSGWGYAFVITDEALAKETFSVSGGITSPVAVTLVRLQQEVKKLDKRLLPDGFDTYRIQVVSAADATAVDFSLFEPGTVVMVIQ